MICQTCGSCNIYCIDTRDRSEGINFRRYRRYKCFDCDARCSTIELPQQKVTELQMNKERMYALDSALHKIGRIIKEEENKQCSDTTGSA